MACKTLVLLDKDCLNNIGGVKSPLLYNDDDQITGETVDGLTGQITGFTSVVSTFLAFNFKKNAVSLAVSKKTDLNEGSNIHEVTLTVSLKRREQVKRQVLEAMGDGQRMLAFSVLDGNGIYWLLRNMQLATQEEANGATKAEGSKYDITFVGEMDDAPRTMDALAVAELLV
tara:strand:- start:4457 stop:4972 length:516 start_codon:yes stop_codon:yes gene_type:complete